MYNLTACKAAMKVACKESAPAATAAQRLFQVTPEFAKALLGPSPVAALGS